MADVRGRERGVQAQSSRRDDQISDTDVCVTATETTTELSRRGGTRMAAG